MAKLAPPDDRVPVPLSAAELAAARAVADSRERLKIHRLLLTESMRRLRAGRALERSHGVIHPEMTCVIRDCLRLADLVFPAGAERSAVVVETAAEVVARSAGAVALDGLVKRHGAKKLTARSGVSGGGRMSALCRGEAPTEAERAGLARVGIAIELWDEVADGSG